MPAFDLQPTLIGPRVTIRPIAPSDWQEMFAAASDPEIWTLHPASDRYKEPVFRKFFDGAIASGSGFAFVERESGKIIGSSRYHAYDPALSEIEIGWTFLARSHWGGSYNREVKRLMLEHAFQFVDTVALLGRRDELAFSSRDGEDRRRAPAPALTAALPIPRPHVVFEIRKPDFRPLRSGVAPSIEGELCDARLIAHAAFRSGELWSSRALIFGALRAAYSLRSKSSPNRA